NQWIIEALPSWPKDWHVIHLTGKERRGEIQEMAALSGAFTNYHVYKFFTIEMKEAFALADVVVARAGFSTITELASLSKASILLPIPDSHQEKNVKMLAENNAVVAMNQKTDSGLNLAQIVKQLMAYPEERQRLGERLYQILPRAKPERIVEIIKELCYTK
ncbi:MAG: glycosyltransferase, partial [bacterium]|nr:glycosyltransferase [bacterium]